MRPDVRRPSSDANVSDLPVNDAKTLPPKGAGTDSLRWGSGLESRKLLPVPVTYKDRFSLSTSAR